ncbi:MAG: WYL domain-containing protein [Desulfobacterales bacterium]|nr:WYL domain-containing protein [Desulfobacterales bacterium]
MSWVLGFVRQAEVLEPEHLRKAVAEELAASAEKYIERPADTYQRDLG